MPYPPGLAFLEQELEHSVLHIPVLEILHAPADAVQEVVVYVVRPEILEGLPVHEHRVLSRPVAEIGELRRYVVGLPRMAAQREPGGRLALSLKIDRGGVEVVDAVGEGIIYKLVHRILVDDVLPVPVLFHLPAHTAVAEHADLVPCSGVCPVCHLPALRRVAGPSGLRLVPSVFTAARKRAGCHGRSRSHSARLYEFSSFHLFLNQTVTSNSRSSSHGGLSAPLCRSYNSLWTLCPST